MTAQKEFTLTPRRRGFHLVTEEIIRNLPPLPSAGILHLFIKHTSAGLTINENADPDVQTDMEAIFNRLVKNGNLITNIHAKAMTICPPMPRQPSAEPASPSPSPMGI